MPSPLRFLSMAKVPNVMCAICASPNRATGTLAVVPAILTDNYVRSERIVNPLGEAPRHGHLPFFDFGGVRDPFIRRSINYDKDRSFW